MIINSFVNRLAKLGIKVTFVGNYPWIYLDTVNGIRVTERYGANHGYHAFTLSTNSSTKMYDRKHLFKTVRKYLNITAENYS